MRVNESWKQDKMIFTRILQNCSERGWKHSSVSTKEKEKKQFSGYGKIELPLQASTN